MYAQRNTAKSFADWETSLDHLSADQGQLEFSTRAEIQFTTWQPPQDTTPGSARARRTYRPSGGASADPFALTNASVLAGAPRGASVPGTRLLTAGGTGRRRCSLAA